MHTSSGVDAVDEYLETVTKKGDHYVYKVGAEERPVVESTITVPYKTDKGMASKTFTRLCPDASRTGDARVERQVGHHRAHEQAH